MHSGGCAGLIAAMSAAGVTVDDVAGVIGRKPATVARWLNGEGRGFTLQDVERARRELLPAMSLNQLAKKP